MTTDAAPANKLAHAARILLGFAFTFFSIMALLNLIKPPAALPPKVVEWDTAMMDTGYLFQLIAGTQLVGGLLILLNRFVPLGLTLLAPVLVNIVLFHLFLELDGSIVPGLVLSALELYLAWAYRDAFRPILSARHRPI